MLGHEVTLGSRYSQQIRVFLDLGPGPGRSYFYAAQFHDFQSSFGSVFRGFNHLGRVRT